MTSLSSLTHRVWGHRLFSYPRFAPSSGVACNARARPHRARTSTFSSPSSGAGPGGSVAMSVTNVAFVGLGNMGLRMALNLARPSRDDALGIPSSPPPLRLTVYDLQESNVASFFGHVEAMEGLSESTYPTASRDLPSLAESNPDFVITSLPTCEASEDVVGSIVRGLPGVGGGCTFVDTSTVSPSTSKKLHNLVSSTSPHHQYVDAPVSGGVKGATDATLTFMVGCSSPETFSNVRPLLLRMGTNAIPCGMPGSGSAVKLCNNAALAAQMLGICEAMNLGEALGVDPMVLADVMNASTAKCWSGMVNNPHPEAARHIGSGASAGGYGGGFASALMLKDLNLAVSAGEGEGLALPVSGLTRDLYRLAIAHGYGSKDFGVMLQFLRGGSR
ncbi:hypothetical protein ACHAXA_008151 [Cyclostephanos tholiformis]|uniref:3-hydroxyisobutyrate dehydrogenase n=1 Tax=Cyclostephanos tholiformis TaxID=382380 RepID=A0ABD3SEN2_9STRA